MRLGARHDGEDGQVSVALVATLPALLLAVAVAVQLALAGHAALAASVSARAAARAAHVGGEPEQVGIGALPGSLRERAEVRADGGRVEVTVEVPRLLPGLPRLPLTVGSELGPEGTGG